MSRGARSITRPLRAASQALVPPTLMAEYTGGSCLDFPTKPPTKTLAKSGSNTSSGTTPVRMTSPSQSSVSVAAPKTTETT